MNLDHEFWLNQAASMAMRALCKKDKCGAVLVTSSGHCIGEGYNAPPRDEVDQCMCGNTHPSLKKPKSDRTCCIHAEWRALFDALKINPSHMKGSILYFSRSDDLGNIKKSGNPYCTVCSRIALDLGVAHWVLWNKDEGIKVYDALEYNRLSYQFDDV